MPTDDKDSIKIMKLCPRFDRCSVPICPLDTLQDDRVGFKNDPQCTLAKSYRLKIGQNTTLERKGLTKLEWAAKQRWDNLSESQKASKKADLRGNSPFIRGNQTYRKLTGDR
jgi:hypothetical protein